MITQAKPKVVVLGGGFAGLEFAFYLRMRLRDRADITLVSDHDQFLFKPNTIYIPFGLDYRKLQVPLVPATRRKHIGFILGQVWETDPVGRVVYVDRVMYTGDYRLDYDFLVIATGAGMRPDEIPGLSEYAHTIWTPEDMLELREAYNNLLEDAREGKRRWVLFLVPPNNKCAGPLYEMVFMLDTWLRRHGARQNVDITFTTYEETFIQAFGPRLHEVVAGKFERRGIQGYNRFVVERVDKGEVNYRHGYRRPSELLVSFPPYVASRPFPGLPTDDRGFITTDPATRQVVGHPEIYAVGDAGDFPVKQAFLAFLQADAAAEHLACTVLGAKTSVAFEPTSMCVMEQFDTATFAQVPLRPTGLQERPVEVRTEADGAYKVGTSPLWRLGKKLPGVYLAWRFNAGNPFHAGLPWRAMDLGLRAMSALLAH